MASPNHSNGGTGVPPALPSIPLSAETSTNGSVGALVREATAQVSTLVRSELELAKAELTGEVKKGAIGAAFFIAALTILLFSAFFFFIAVAELLSEWLQRWAAYLIVFGVMALAAGIAAYIGFLTVRRIRAPRRTIDTVKETASVFSQIGRDSDADADGRW